jgi:glycosyltransferase involved in cell wall biosynthesis
LLKDKGVLEFIEAIKILKSKYENVEFQILGEVSATNKTAITRDELNVWIDKKLIHYLGTTDNVQDIISKVDCVVLPSYREGTPRSLLEAAAMSKPIVTTDVVGCKEVVDDRINGYLCEAKNAYDLAKKMEMIINLSNEERKAMGRVGREKVIKEFDEKIVISKYIQSIKEILNT